jgi:hypothetical protein
MARTNGFGAVDGVYYFSWLDDCCDALGVIMIENFRLNIQGPPLSEL